jgi:DNA-binding MarR family transcriptional regulator
MQSLGIHFSHLAKFYLGALSARLSTLEIDRYFYPLLLINESDGSMCQKDLAEKLKVDNVTMVRIIDYLSKAGYLNRMKSEKDRRMHYLVLTPKAKQKLPEIKSAYKQINNICFKGFDKEEKENFQILLLKMKENLMNNPRREFKLNFQNISK